jgi:hypothetical protein
MYYPPFCRMLAVTTPLAVNMLKKPLRNTVFSKEFL